MGVRINLDNEALPGVAGERTITMGDELERVQVFADGEYLGEVVYVARKREGSTTYGWWPARAAAQSSLTSKADAVRRLPRMVERADYRVWP